MLRDQLAKKTRMLGAFMICMAMFGNGARTGTHNTQSQALMIQKDRFQGVYHLDAYFVEGAPNANHGNAVPQIGVSWQRSVLLRSKAGSPSSRSVPIIAAAAAVGRGLICVGSASAESVSVRWLWPANCRVSSRPVGERPVVGVPK